MKISRYSIYFVPDGPLGKFGASWLGWDIQAREFVPLLHIENNKIDLNKITEEPRTYIRFPRYAQGSIPPKLSKD